MGNFLSWSLSCVPGQEFAFDRVPLLWPSVLSVLHQQHCCNWLSVNTGFAFWNDCCYSHHMDCCDLPLDCKCTLNLIFIFSFLLHIQACTALGLLLILSMHSQVLGGIAGKNNKSEFYAPCRTNKYPREIPALPWYRKTVPQVCLHGIGLVTNWFSIDFLDY